MQLAGETPALPGQKLPFKIFCLNLTAVFRMVAPRRSACADRYYDVL
jgi:hypothetical protein